MSNLGETGCFIAIFVANDKRGKLVSKHWRWRVLKRGAPFVIGTAVGAYQPEQIPVEILRIPAGNERHVFEALAMEPCALPFVRIVGRDRLVHVGMAPDDEREIDLLLAQALGTKHAEQRVPS